MRPRTYDRYQAWSARHGPSKLPARPSKTPPLTLEGGGKKQRLFLPNVAKVLKHAIAHGSQLPWMQRRECDPCQVLFALNPAHGKTGGSCLGRRHENGGALAGRGAPDLEHRPGLTNDLWSRQAVQPQPSRANAPSQRLASRPTTQPQYRCRRPDCRRHASHRAPRRQPPCDQDWADSHHQRRPWYARSS